MLGLRDLVLCCMALLGAAIHHTKSHGGHEGGALLQQRSALGQLYHSSEELEEAIVDLAAQSDTITVEQLTHGGATLAAVRVSGAGGAGSAGAEAKLKAVFFFGEHARELISPESALGFLKRLAKDDEKAKKALEYFDVLLFPNINPGSRKRVERGEYCLRANPNGVDLNRNWNDHWEHGVHGTDTFGGEHAFSEDETQILKEATTAFKPDMFLTVHSGVLGMYSPRAYSTDIPSGPEDGPNEAAMLDILNNLNPKYCNCAVGAAGKEVGYLCPGTCLDFIYDGGCPYAFAFEIYGREGYKNEYMSTKWQESSCFLEAIEHTHVHQHDHHHDHDHDHHHDHDHAGERSQQLLQMSSLSRGLFPEAVNFAEERCLSDFNPTTQEDYEATVANWAEAYLDLMLEVAELHHKTHNR